MAADPRVVTALVDAQAAARDRITLGSLALLVALWRAFTGWYSDDAVRRLSLEMADIVRDAQRLTGDLTGAYLERVLDEYGVLPARMPQLLLPDDLRRGVDLADVYARPARNYRYLRSTDVSELDALSRAETRLEVTADTDLALAMREASRQVLASVPKVTGYRRVIHPELSRTGTCGLCMVASDRTYSVGTLLPIHARCRCTTLPIIGDEDPGRDLNAEDLEAIYEAAGGTDAARLKRVRVKVQNHGELGPVLVDAEHHQRGPADVKPAPDPRERAAAELAVLERTYAGLLERQARGEDVSRPLAYQRDRIALLREQVGRSTA